ncbi:MAG TPA: endonuclease/exonuclease/phosphatase family protein [Bacteroidales bacterium]|nr:endonuclease/exonuclease/phosphatase family protein [Bacteroidales bacterium]
MSYSAMHTIRKFLRAIIYLIIALWLIFFGIIIYGYISDYRPAEKVVIEENGSAAVLEDSAAISLLTWNIGYCGLGDDMDFFYDGGTQVRTSRESFKRNFSAITDFLRSNDSIDFVFLQEVDRKSRRSYRKDEYAGIGDILKSPSSQFAVNYDVFFVPVPATSPMGKVLSGISVLGKKPPRSSVRYSFPGEYGFPKQLFMLDRCFLVNRYPMKNGKELVLINTHNEAFDPGEIRRAQMEYLKTFLLEEYGKGNYIIAGGDWNQAPPDFKPDFAGDVVNTNQMVMNSDYLPSDWRWTYDNNTPSNRTVTAPYKPDVTATTVIDFFLLSPNVKSVSVKCINLHFRNSDHNPVILSARLND